MLRFLKQSRTKRSVSSVTWMATNALWLTIVLVVVGVRFGNEESQESPLTTPNHRFPPVAAGSNDAASGERRITGTYQEKAAVEAASMGDAIRNALKAEDPLVRSALFSELILRLTPENLEESLSAVEESADGLSDDPLLRNFMLAWARFDPNGAMDYALNVDGDRKFYVRDSDDALMEAWGRGDPVAALDYLEKFEENGQNKKSLHYHLVEGMIDHDLAAATAYAEINEPSVERGYSIVSLAETYMEKGGADALVKWLEGIDPDAGERMNSYQKYALARAVMLVADDKLEAGKQMIEDFARNGQSDYRAVSYVAERMARDDPGQAIEWLYGLPEGVGRDGSVARAVSKWVERDPAQAAEWLASQKRTESLDPAIGSYAWEISTSDPVAAMSWGLEISNEDRRNETLLSLGREWAKRDPQGMGVWLGDKGAALPVGVRAMIGEWVK